MNEEYKRLEELYKRLEQLCEFYEKRNKELEKELETLKKKQRGISEKRREAVMKRWDKRGRDINAPSLTTNTPRRLKDVIDENLRELTDDPDRKAEVFQIQLYQNEDGLTPNTSSLTPNTLSLTPNTSFQRPSEDEVYEYFHMYTMGTLNDIRGETLKFLDHYDANGWMVGINPMRDWRAAVRNWISNRGKFIDNYDKQEKQNEKSRQAFIAAVRDVEEQARYERLYGKEELPF